MSDTKNTISVKKAIENTKEIFLSDSAVSILMDFERVLSEMDIYAFENWIKGELVEGPICEKYFVTCTFLWKRSEMPDPSGGERLLDYDCTVLYKKSSLEYPIKVESPDDFEAGTKMPKMKRVPIWLVEISIPRSLMNDIERGSMELNGEIVELDDIEDDIEGNANEESYDSESTEGDIDDQAQAQ